MLSALIGALSFFPLAAWAEDITISGTHTGDVTPSGASDNNVYILPGADISCNSIFGARSAGAVFGNTVYINGGNVSFSAYSYLDGGSSTTSDGSGSATYNRLIINNGSNVRIEGETYGGSVGA
ncbi:MAG: hypothetical protein LBU43_02550, partial [Candidatus Accumulibacter sp.]|nr:hypothetical protein [Accumulibacter sp.]